MENEILEVKNSSNSYKGYLCEFEMFDGDHFVTFNIIDVNAVKNEITVAVSDQGRISVCTFSLMSDLNETLYFEYGVMLERIALDEFSSEVR